MPNSETKKVGFWVATALIVGNMIGSGIFLLPSSLALYGGISLFGWIFSTIGALSLAYIFGQLSKSVNRGGGPYTFTSIGFGDFAGFWIAWGYWISCWTAVVSISIALTGAMAIFFPILSENTMIGTFFAISLIIIVTMINLLDIKTIGNFQGLTTLLKLLPILFIALFGFVDFNTEHMEPFNLSEESDISAISSTITLTLWAFLGFESATIISHKVKNPEKVIPKATFVGTLFVAIIYISSSFAIMGIINPVDLQASTSPFADAASILWGDGAQKLIAAGVAISCLGAMNGWVLIQGQIPQAAATDNLFPKAFAKLNKNEMPSFAVIFSSLLGIILILATSHLGIVKQFQIIILLSTLTAVIPYAFCTMTYYSSSLKEIEKLSSKEKFKKYALLLIAFTFSFIAIYGSGQETVFSGFLLLVAGLPVYIWMKNNQRKRKLNV